MPRDAAASDWVADAWSRYLDLRSRVYAITDVEESVPGGLPTEAAEAARAVEDEIRRLYSSIRQRLRELERKFDRLRARRLSIRSFLVPSPTREEIEAELDLLERDIKALERMNEEYGDVVESAIEAKRRLTRGQIVLIPAPYRTMGREVRRG